MRVFYKPRKNGTYLYIKTFSNKQQNYAEERKKDGGWVKEGQRKWERKWEEMFILFKMREKMREREKQREREEKERTRERERARERENERMWREKKSDGEFKKK